MTFAEESDVRSKSDMLQVTLDTTCIIAIKNVDDATGDDDAGNGRRVWGA